MTFLALDFKELENFISSQGGAEVPGKAKLDSRKPALCHENWEKGKK
jgi:hypothetical protein